MNQSQDNNIEIESYFTYNWKNDIHNLTVMAGNSVTNYLAIGSLPMQSNFLADTYRQMSLTSDQTSRIGDGGYNLKTRYISWYGRAMYNPDGPLYRYRYRTS